MCTANLNVENNTTSASKSLVSTRLSLLSTEFIKNVSVSRTSKERQETWRIILSNGSSQLEQAKAFEACTNGILQDATRVNCTHSLHLVCEASSSCAAKQSTDLNSTRDTIPIENHVSAHGGLSALFATSTIVDRWIHPKSIKITSPRPTPDPNRKGSKPNCNQLLSCQGNENGHSSQTNLIVQHNQRFVPGNYDPAQSAQSAAQLTFNLSREAKDQRHPRQ